MRYSEFEHKLQKRSRLSTENHLTRTAETCVEVFPVVLFVCSKNDPQGRMGQEGGIDFLYIYI